MDANLGVSTDLLASEKEKEKILNHAAVVWIKELQKLPGRKGLKYLT